MIEIGAHAIHLIDEANARNFVFIGLTPHGFGLRLHARYGVENRDCAVQHTQAPLNFGGEIDVTGCIDNVDLNITPLAGGGGRGDGDAALLFLLHPIHNRRAFMHLANLMGAARVIEDTLGCGCLTGIDMGSDADVSHPFERREAWHD